MGFTGSSSSSVRQMAILSLVVVLLQSFQSGSTSPSIANIDIDGALGGLQQALEGLEQQNENNRLVVRDLTRQTLLNIFQSEDRIRAEGDSGIVQVRYSRLGTKNYHANTFVGTSFISVHDHSNAINTCGMGEFIAVLNGVEFQTRHNDYLLVMPSTTSKDWHATEPVPFPPVPESVTSLPTPEVDTAC
ncbi:uncharacterized protein LOC106011533 [Aplysia californica]|uniref:Uncharacterized protein LOC106011533 n=1 Tax=Aplysia californica TaxID=6500 RepID=A0ABM1VS17_APLCA|nr:uncharacterized protein LOC106011533 [Aplysia californica]